MKSTLNYLSYFLPFLLQTFLLEHKRTATIREHMTSLLCAVIRLQNFCKKMGNHYGVSKGSDYQSIYIVLVKVKCNLSARFG